MNAINIVALIANLSFVVSIVFFFVSLVQLVYKKKLPLHYFLSIVFFSTGIQYLSFWVYCQKNPFFENYLIYSDNSFIFLIGPFLYWYFSYITGGLPISSRKILFSIAPFFLSLFLIETINLYFPFFRDKAGQTYVNILSGLSYFSVLLYLIMILKTLSLYYRKNKTSEIKILIVFIKWAIAFSLILNLSNILGWEFFYLLSHSAFFCFPLFYIFFSLRYPEFSMRVLNKNTLTHYKNTPHDENHDVVIAGRLLHLMEREKLYNREVMSLSVLSSVLVISPHELSRILNVQFEQNYNSFINGYRIEEAKRLFRESKDRSILYVTYEVGFRTKSSFYQNFVKIVGMTPGEFKKSIPEL